MPTLARPEVDVLDGFTTAIIVDQERMGTNPRSTVGTATDANAMLRILFSRLGQPHIGSPKAFAFNVPSVAGEWLDHRRAGRGQDQGRSRRPSPASAACARAARAWARVSDFDLTQMYDDSKSLNEGALTIPGYSMDGWYGRIFSGCGFFDPDKPIKKFTKRELHDLLYKEPTKIKVEGINLTYEGLIPTIQKSMLSKDVDATAAARPGVRRAGGDVHHLPRLRRHPAQRGGPLVEDRRGQHRRGVRDADQRPRRVGPRPRRAVGGTAARGAAADARLVRGDRARLPLARPAVGHAVGRRGAAHEDDPPPRLVAHRRHLRLRRADGRAAPARHPADERAAAAAARQGQHGARRRAQAGGDRHRRPRRRPRPRRRFGRRHHLLRGHRRRAADQRHHHRPPPRRPGVPQGRGADGHRRPRDPRRRHQQPAEGRRRHPARRALRDHRRGRLRQELADPRLGVRTRRGGDGRPGSDQGLAAQQPGDLHRPARPDPQGVRQGQRGEAGAVQRQLRRRLPQLQRRRRHLHRPGDHGDRRHHLRGVRGEAVRRRRCSSTTSAAATSARCSRCR